MNIKEFIKGKMLSWSLGYDRSLARSSIHFIKNLKQDKQLIGAEIGVFQGNHARKLMNGFLNIKKLYLIDPWNPYIDVTGSYKDIVGTKNYWDNLYFLVKYLFKDNKKVEIIRETSIKAASRFPNEYFDFIYIDGDHSYVSVLDDLNVWYPKLKKFGVMCGDDFGHQSGLGVIQAVSEFAYQKKLLVMNSTIDNQFWFVKYERYSGEEIK